MLRLALALLAVVTFVNAQQLDDIIAQTLSQHASLKSIEQRMSALDDAVEQSQLFDNPSLSLGINDIQLSDMFNRSLEPMQTSSLSLKQKIPYFGKRSARRAVLQARKAVIYRSLEAAQTALVESIKLTAYAIWEREERLNIVEELLHTLEQSMELQAVYSRTDNSAHMQMMIAELSLSQLKIKQSTLAHERHGLYARLRYLADTEISELHLDLHVNELTPFETYAAKLHDNRKVQLQNARLNEAKRSVAVAQLSQQSDIIVGVAYNYREAYTDYVNINVALSLPIYGSEALAVQASQKKVLEASLAHTDTLEQVRSRLKENYELLHSAYTIEHIIVDETLPQVDHMLELADTAVRNGADMSDYLELIERKLLLDEQRISAVARYYSAQARLDALIGERR